MTHFIVGCFLGIVIGSIHNYHDFGDESIPYKWIKALINKMKSNDIVSSGALKG